MSLQPKPYVSIEELATLTPWSVRTIRRKMQRRELKRGVHYFQPGGRNAMLLFDWNAVEAYIRGEVAPPAESGIASRGGAPARPIRLAGGRTLDIDALEQRYPWMFGKTA